MDEDDTARAECRRMIDLELADQFALGWTEMVMLELSKMRAQMPYADRLELRLVCERRSD